METLGIIVVIEQGDLEQKTKLLVESIRTFGGEMKNVKIWTVKPRKGKPLTKKTLDFLKNQNVEFIDINVNKKWHLYGLANKIYACAYIEENFGDRYETLLFLDSDTLIIDEIDSNILEGKYDVAIKPLDGEYLALRANEEVSPFWELIYETCGVCVDNVWKVNTTVNNTEILAYFNSGVIFSNPRSLLFSAWLKNFEFVCKDKRAYQLRHLEYYFLEQALLSGTILGQLSRDKVKILDYKFNYSLNFHSQFEDKQGNNLNEIRILHYHSSFYKNWEQALPIVVPELTTWLNQRLPLVKHEKSVFQRWGNVVKYVSWRLLNKLLITFKPG